MKKLAEGSPSVLTIFTIPDSSKTALDFGGFTFR
jgi:hypothetical protein